MLNKKTLLIVVVLTLLIMTGSVYAIAGGVPDGYDHPAVGVIFVDDDGDGIITNGNGDDVIDEGEDWAQCSGSYVGVSKDGQHDVFLTAAHCFADWAPSDLPIIVAFDSDVLDGWFYGDSGNREVDPTLVTPLSQELIWDPAYDRFGRELGHDAHDAAVILFPVGSISSLVIPEGPYAGQTIQPVELPPEGFLDDLKAAKELKKTPITLAAYGVKLDRSLPRFTQYSFDFERQTGTTSVQGLSSSRLRLSAHKNAEDPGLCSLDSGSPQFIGDTNMIVSTHMGGRGFCGATSYSYRLDTVSARDFLGQYLDLP